jgi:membrane fusion protein, multidrug efflux system
VKPDKTVEIRNVTVPVTQGNLSEIASGVLPDELIVTDGQDKLQQGSHVDTHIQAEGNRNAQSGTTNPVVPSASSNPAQAQRRGNAQNRNQNRGTASQ